MTRRPCRNHAATFKAKVALAALKGDKSPAKLSQQFDLHPNQITEWKSRLHHSAQLWLRRTRLGLRPCELLRSS